MFPVVKEMDAKPRLQFRFRWSNAIRVGRPSISKKTCPISTILSSCLRTQAGKTRTPSASSMKLIVASSLVLWLEAVVYPGRKGCGHPVVNYETASRNGRFSEAVCAKYGLPNQTFKLCAQVEDQSDGLLREVHRLEEERL